MDILRVLTHRNLVSRVRWKDWVTTHLSHDQRRSSHHSATTWRHQAVIRTCSSCRNHHAISTSSSSLAVAVDSRHQRPHSSERTSTTSGKIRRHTPATGEFLLHRRTAAVMSTRAVLLADCSTSVMTTVHRRRPQATLPSLPPGNLAVLHGHRGSTLCSVTQPLITRYYNSLLINLHVSGYQWLLF